MFRPSWSTVNQARVPRRPRFSRPASVDLQALADGRLPEIPALGETADTRFASRLALDDAEGSQRRGPGDDREHDGQALVRVLDHSCPALFTGRGYDSTSVLSDAPLRLDIEEGNGRGWRGKHCAKARQYGSPLLPVLRVDPV
ncbi:hypothetical protein GCM10022285_29890 [Streptomyces tunisiensis]|uniref:Uncharacterized protein n=1 Tax=Streptomyces tunisiensis TaxID=948699 RepID=A0ABP7YHC9_9ACTN